MTRWVGMGCMRLSTDVDAASAHAVIAAALEAGVTLFDTAASYGPETEPHHNERLLAAALGDATGRVTIVTKAGMRRARGRWRPDGRRKAILQDAAQSREALGRAPDASLLHLPDPAVSFATSVRALIAARDAGYTQAIGLSNVTLGQLEEARALTPIAFVELPIGPLDEDSVRGGVVERCFELGIPVLAHAPLGGPDKQKRWAQDEDLRWLADAHEVTPQTVLLAWLHGLHPLLTPIPGPRTSETARLAAGAATLTLRDDERALLDERFPLGRLLRTDKAARRVRSARREVVLFVGIPGAGKTRVAGGLDHLRLSRDERGGTLRQLAAALGDALDEGADHVLMDATYPTRAARNRVLETAWEHGASVRCLWLDTPLEQAQVNAVDRMLARTGTLLAGAELKAAGKADPNLFPPSAQYRFRDRFEPPTLDEGYATLERIPFEREPIPGHDAAGLVIDLATVQAPSRGIDPNALRPWLRSGVPTLILGWLPNADPGPLAEQLAAIAPELEAGVCTHPPGPAICWCRPPLPGLAVRWLRAHRIAPAKVTHIGAGPASEKLAETLGFFFQPTRQG